MSEIGEEKIDIILWNDDPKVYISNALSPAKVSEIEIDDVEKKAVVKVAEDQLSLAIGRQGQNVRLAAKLTGWNVDIQGGDEAGVEATAKMIRPVEEKRDLEDEILKVVESGSEATPVEEPIVAESQTTAKTIEPKVETTEEETTEKEETISEPESALGKPIKETEAETELAAPDVQKPETSESEETKSEMIHDIHSSDDMLAEENPAETTGVDDVAAILEEEKEEKAS
jgi:hypothetical protein